MNSMFAIFLLAIPAAIDPDDPLPAPKEAKKVEAKQLKRVMVSTEAAAIALDDALKLHPLQAALTRYIFDEEATPESTAALELKLALISLASTPVKPVVLANGHIVRIDLSKYAPRSDDLQLWIDTWESFQFDPCFAALLTKDHIEFLRKQSEPVVPFVQVKRAGPRRVGEWVLVDIPPTPEGATRRWVFKTVEAPSLDGWPEWLGATPTNGAFQATPVTKIDDTEIKNLNVIRANGPHIDPAVFLELQNRTGSLAPIVSNRYFSWRALTTVKDDGLFADVYGGRYYEFSKIRTAKEAAKEAKDGEAKRKLTDLDVLFKDLGLGDDSKKLFEDLRSDQRIAMLESKVTGKWRVVFIFPTPTTGEGRISVVMVTLDPRDKDIDHKQNPFLNLANPNGFAHEIIFTKRNGLFGVSLNLAADGSRVDSVGQDIAADRTIPVPHTPVLQGIMGCLSCHCASGSSLWIDAPNDVKILLDSKIDVFGDLTDKKKTIPETLDRLSGLYLGDTEVLFSRGRDDFNRAVYKTTRQKKIDQQGLLVIGKTVTNEIVDDYHRHRYARIDAQKALREVGFVAETNAQAITVLRELLPVDQEAVVIGEADKIEVEDPRIAALLAGLSINRVDWDLIRSPTTYRTQKALALIPKKKP